MGKRTCYRRTERDQRGVVTFVTTRPFSFRHNLVCRRVLIWQITAILKSHDQKYGDIACLPWGIEN